MRILHVISNLEVGGAEKMVVTIANASVKSGITVGVCLLVSGGPLLEQLDSRVKVLELNRQWRFDWRALKTFATWARQYDLLHVHLKHNVKYVYLVNLLFGIPVPVLLHDHSAEVLVKGVPKTKLPFFVLGWLRRQYYLAVSEQLMQWAIINLGLNPDRASWLSNAIECKPVPVSSKNKPDLIKLLLVSNFRRIKNIEFAVDLMVEMLKEGLPVTLDIVGRPLDRKYFTEITDKIQQEGLRDYIRFRHNVNDVIAIIPEYTLGLNCSYAETGPLVLLEFMCARLPFVSYLNGEVALRISKEYPILIIDTLELKVWIKRIKIILTELSVISERLHLLFNNNFSINQYMMQLESKYKSMLN